MYIGRLQLKGFKSFGGSHDLLLSSGFTAIVGPNGSGKSNLLDALRWALGDSSAGRLRISRQSDLLFQGSASQQAAKEAEVTLQLREDDRTASIKRRVTSPDGVTALFVDNSRKTLTELDNVKRDWKLEGDKFAFIGQGEVAEAIQERPAARRMRLETLFGIDVYRKRRQDAANRLVTVRDEYDQLRNIMAELSARREEIAPEVRRAAQIRGILDSIEDDRRLLYWLRRNRAELALARISSDLEKAVLDKDKFIIWSGMWKLASDAVEAELEKASRARQQQTWELEQCRVRFDGFTKSGFASAAALRSAKGRLAQVQEECERAKKHLASLLEEQRQSEADNKTAKTALNDSQKALDSIEKKWQEYNRRLEEEKEQREAWNSEKGSLEAELQQIKAKLSFLGKDLLQLRDKKTEAPDHRRELDSQIKQFETERDKQLAEQEMLVKHHGELYAKLQNLLADVQRARREASQARSRLNEANDAVQSELYPQAVQFLLSAARLKKLNADPKAVIDVFNCDASLSTALEAYLGGRQFQLLVEDMEEAGRCIDLLRVNSRGRATFLPLERCRPRFPDRSFRLPANGITGWAIDLVEVEPHWLTAIQQIMGDLLIVNSYDIGKELVRSGFRGPVATLDGDVFQPGGTVSGGRSQKSGKAIEMKAQIARLQQEAAQTAAVSEKLSAQFKKLEAEEIKASEEKENYTRVVRELDGRIATLADQKDLYAKEQRRLDGERGRILASMSDEGKHWQSILASLADLAEKWDRPLEIEDDRQLIEERERLRAAVAVAAEKMRSSFAILDRVSTEMRAEERKTWSLDEELSGLDQKCVQERANLAHVGRSCLEIHNRRLELINELDMHVDGYSKLEEKREYLKNRLNAANERIRSGAGKLALIESKKSETERDLEELTSTWEEQYPYPGGGALPDGENIEELRHRIRDGERKIKSYGDVNMGVLSEDTSLKDRLAFLGTQLDDVNASVMELERLITDADNQAYNAFTDAMRNVDDRFCFLFQRLFGGGEAHLEITDSDTIWEAGVDVVARPPGKHPQSINQLSGGEQSLAAISLLFASMEVAGCPLAVLDEVDAALDEVNLRRFSELAKEYAKNRQILAMTHRRVTMERADVLYGVTLSEPGLSQVIGVRLEDWA